MIFKVFSNLDDSVILFTAGHAATDRLVLLPRVTSVALAGIRL